MMISLYNARLFTYLSLSAGVAISDFSNVKQDYSRLLQ